jgi:hypothetical protein
MPTLTLLAIGLSWLGQAYAGFNANAKNNVAVYWGQNSYGINE